MNTYLYQEPKPTKRFIITLYGTTPSARPLWRDGFDSLVEADAALAAWDAQPGHPTPSAYRVRLNPAYVGSNASGEGEGGIKHDDGKLRYDLLFATPALVKAVESLVRVLMLGAKKYGDSNWTQVPDHKRRYFAAALRHLIAWMRGEKVDSESGESHLAHCLACVLFLLAREDEP